MGIGVSLFVLEGVIVNFCFIYIDNLFKYDCKVSRKKFVYFFFLRDCFGVNMIILWYIDRFINFVFFNLKEINFYYCLFWNFFYGKINFLYNFKINIYKIKVVFMYVL